MKNGTINKMFWPPLLDDFERFGPGPLPQISDDTVLRTVERMSTASGVRDESDRRARLREILAKEVRNDPAEMERARREVMRITGTKTASDSQVDIVIGHRVAGRLSEVIRRRPFDFPLSSAVGRPEVVLGTNHYLALLLRLADTGEQTFRVFPDIAEALIRTRIRVPQSSFRLPYTTMEFLVPPNVTRRWSVPHDEAGKAYPLRSIVLSDALWNNNDSLEPVACLTVFGRDDANVLRSMSSFSFSLRELMFGGEGAEEAMIDEEKIHGAVFRVSGTSIAKSHVLWGALRLAFNLILYVNAEESDVRPSPQMRDEDAREKFDSAKGAVLKRRGARVRDIGRRVSLPGIRGGEDRSGNGSGGKLRWRHWVRGHWHTYRVGGGKAETVVKWIRPYEKGVEKGLPRKRGRVYEVEGA